MSRGSYGKSRRFVVGSEELTRQAVKRQDPSKMFGNPPPTKQPKRAEPVICNERLRRINPDLA